MRVLCVACGPSLSPEQIVWANKQDCMIIVVNNAYRVIDFPDIVLAADHEWWLHHNPLIGRRVTTCMVPIDGVVHFSPSVRGSFSSGGRAIEYAYQIGASRIELIGYDCSVSNGTHFHGDHVGMSNPTNTTCARWIEHHRRIADWLPRHVEVINYSLYTEIPDDIYKRHVWAG